MFQAKVMIMGAVLSASSLMSDGAYAGQGMGGLRPCSPCVPNGTQVAKAIGSPGANLDRTPPIVITRPPGTGVTLPPGPGLPPGTGIPPLGR